MRYSFYRYWRMFLALTALILSLAGFQASYAGNIIAVRAWPAEDYTRVTLEHEGGIQAKHFMLTNPERLVVDITGTELTDTLRELVSKIQPDDPYIQKVRVGQLDPLTVRMVFDLKAPVNPQVFSLQPYDKYKHRLVLDLYPKDPIDPIAALIQKGEWKTDPSETPSKQAQAEQAKQPASQQQKPSEPAKQAPAKEEKAQAKQPAAKEQKAPASDTTKKAAAAATPPAAAASSDKTQLKRMVTIVIDPGHGGEDPGAIGARGTKEKDVVLSIGKRLKAKIEQQPNMRVVMTRNADFFVPLGTRVQKARAVKADLFISIHADAFIQPSAKGASVFVLSEKGASSTAARWLAKRQNEADLIGGVNIKNQDKQLASVLLDLSTTAQIKNSLKLGDAVLTEMGTINRLHRGSVERAGFAVLKAPDIPSILVETAFISNPEEEAKLRDEKHQDNVANAILKGIKKYFAKNPPRPKNNML